MASIPIRIAEQYEQSFHGVDQRAYAVLDGASIPNLLHSLNFCRAESVCLYRGELDPELSAVAPYLVALPQDSPIFEWFVAGLGNHWGIVALSSKDLPTMRNHFRKFLMVYDENGKPVYFRFYDPRVLRTYLPACNADESQMFFGPVERYLAETEVSGELLCFYPDNQTVGSKEKITESYSVDIWTYQ